MPYLCWYFIILYLYSMFVTLMLWKFFSRSRRNLGGKEQHVWASFTVSILSAVPHAFSQLIQGAVLAAKTTMHWFSKFLCAWVYIQWYHSLANLIQTNCPFNLSCVALLHSVADELFVWKNEIIRRAEFAFFWSRRGLQCPTTENSQNSCLLQ